MERMQFATLAQRLPNDLSHDDEAVVEREEAVTLLPPAKEEIYQLRGVLCKDSQVPFEDTRASSYIMRFFNLGQVES